MNVIRDLIANLESSLFSKYISSWIYLLCHLIPGQIWNGQGIVLETLSDIISKCKDHIVLSGMTHHLPLLVIDSKDSSIDSINIDNNISEDYLCFQRNEKFETIIKNNNIKISNFDWRVNIEEFCLFVMKGNRFSL